MRKPQRNCREKLDLFTELYPLQFCLICIGYSVESGPARENVKGESTRFDLDCEAPKLHPQCHEEWDTLHTISFPFERSVTSNVPLLDELWASGKYYGFCNKKNNWTSKKYIIKIKNLDLFFPSISKVKSTSLGFTFQYVLALFRHESYPSPLNIQEVFMGSLRVCLHTACVHICSPVIPKKDLHSKFYLIRLWGGEEKRGTSGVLVRDYPISCPCG